MSSETAIRVENLGKCYQIYEKPRDRLLQMLFRGRRQFFREFWALRDVSFRIAIGEVVGIVGRNGSGKSTLLQLVCGTLNPTTGTVRASGRVAALLELGAGFNPEFTGRENVYMNGALLGLAREEIDARYEEICAFSEIGDFIHEPVKTYSSGMYVRLAFATAIHCDPDILVIDEALAVGDIFFQQRCFQRLKAMKEAGKTILFVSHDLNSVQLLCDRAILLHEGRMVVLATPKLVTNEYVRMHSGDDAALPKPETGLASSLPDAASAGEYRYGDRRARILAFGIRKLGDEVPVDVVELNETTEIYMRVQFLAPCRNPVGAFYLKDRRGTELYSGNTHYLGQPIGARSPGDVIELVFTQDMSVAPGEYTLSFGVSEFVDGISHPMDRRYDAGKLVVSSPQTVIGVVDLRSRVRTVSLECTP